VAVLAVVSAACAPLGLEPAEGAADDATSEATDEGEETTDTADATTEAGDAAGAAADDDTEDGRAADGSRAPADTSDAAGDATGPALPPPSDGLEPRRTRSFTIAAVGDVLPHPPLIERAAAYGSQSGQPYDFRPMFAEVAPIIQAADLAFCNMETPLATDHELVRRYLGQRTPAGGAPIFIAPRELGEAMAEAGFNACSTANNHASDVGVEGLVATLEVLEDVGIAASGTGRTPEEVREPAWLEINGVTIALLSATYGVNIPLPAGQEWMVEVIDVERILDQARAAREAGAEFVILSLHQGLEYQIPLSDGQRERTGPLLEDGAVDLILGHHAHVVQAIQRLHGRVAVQGLGNILSNQYAGLTGPETQDGVIALLEVSEHAAGTGFHVSDVSYVPTWVDRDRHVIVDVGTALASEELGPGRRGELEGSLARTVDAINREGADTWGVEPSAGTAWFDARRTESVPAG
jgi:poly-gamma-glutamate capsule biosynthesis protein CapA/YwtB (metallophosphatase superfamily)